LPHPAFWGGKGNRPKLHLQDAGDHWLTVRFLPEWQIFFQRNRKKCEFNPLTEEKNTTKVVSCQP
jgi:hypothetical protein